MNLLGLHATGVIIAIKISRTKTIKQKSTVRSLAVPGPYNVLILHAVCAALTLQRNSYSIITRNLDFSTVAETAKSKKKPEKAKGTKANK